MYMPISKFISISLSTSIPTVHCIFNFETLLKKRM